jgi:hypothetical protein
MWAKQVPAVFAHEVAVTSLLFDIDPGIVPPIVAADVMTGRMLMEHVDGPSLDAERSAVEPWTAAIARLAETQRVLAADLRALEVAGVPRASLGHLASRLPAMLDPAHPADPGEPNLPEADRAILGTAIPELAAVCHALAATPFGPSLEHGDLVAGQVIVGAMGPVFLDWSDATIAHPFIAAASFLAGPTSGPGLTDDLVDALSDAYLAGWPSPTATSREALQLARLVQPLHVAGLLQDRILPGLEQPWELSWMVPGLLGRVAAHLRAGSATLSR